MIFMESLFISQTENGNFLNDETYFKSKEFSLSIQYFSFKRCYTEFCQPVIWDPKYNHQKFVTSYLLKTENGKLKFHTQKILVRMGQFADEYFTNFQIHKCEILWTWMFKQLTFIFCCFLSPPLPSSKSMVSRKAKDTSRDK